MLRFYKWPRVRNQPRHTHGDTVEKPRSINLLSSYTHFVLPYDDTEQISDRHSPSPNVLVLRLGRANGEYNDKRDRERTACGAIRTVPIARSNTSVAASV